MTHITVEISQKVQINCQGCIDHERYIFWLIVDIVAIVSGTVSWLWIRVTTQRSGNVPMA